MGNAPVRRTGPGGTRVATGGKPAAPAPGPGNATAGSAGTGGQQGAGGGQRGGGQQAGDQGGTGDQIPFGGNQSADQGGGNQSADQGGAAGRQGAAGDQGGGAGGDYLRQRAQQLAEQCCSELVSGYVELIRSALGFDASTLADALRMAADEVEGE